MYLEHICVIHIIPCNISHIANLILKLKFLFSQIQCKQVCFKLKKNLLRVYILCISNIDRHCPEFKRTYTLYSYIYNKHINSFCHLLLLLVSSLGEKMKYYYRVQVNVCAFKLNDSSGKYAFRRKPLANVLYIDQQLCTYIYIIYTYVLY